MKDEITPDAPWVFDESVTDVFDDMLARSIPQYDEMRRLVFEVGQRFVRPVGGTIVDLGSSRGEALTRFVDRFGANARFRGFDVSEPMLAAARQRFQGWEPYVTFERLDLRTGYPTPTADLTLAVLVLMFVPIEHRLRVLRNVRSHTTGAAVFVEKVLGSSADTDDLLVSLHLDEKRRSGYTDEQIDRKRLALEGVLVPVSADENLRMFTAAGFSRVECFWRWANFAGWVALP